MGDDTWTRYQLRRKLFAIGEDFWVQNDRGEAVFRVDGKVLRIRKTFVLEDPEGRELAKVDGKLVAVRPTMRIEREGRTGATVKKALFSALHQRYTIELEDGPDLEASGDVLDHEYEIRAGDRLVATISNAWFTLRDAYGVAIAPDQDPVLLLAAAVAIDELSDRDHHDR
ncbi:MAG: LURP-one-related family protein [Candidatus Dormibacteraeota bacterium]|nr:LURP-one-related family protein [Candidatus Dormibacteraeota bacterium]